LQGVPPLGGVKQWLGRKNNLAYFEAKCVNSRKL